jgi:hypothetical protein
MIRFERAAPGKYAATRDGRTLAYIHRFQTKWIAWDARTHRALHGPFGLGGSPFNTLAQAKQHIHYQYG